MSVAAPELPPPPAADQATAFLNLYLREREKRLSLERELTALDGAVAALSARLEAAQTPPPPAAMTPAALLAAVKACGIGDDPELRAAHWEAVRLRTEAEEAEHAEYLKSLDGEDDD